MKFEAKVITPEIAKKYLEKNTGNRKLRDSIVAKYAKDLSNGNWKKNTGETIKIAPSGRILDGQHRLAAIVKSGKSFQFHLATDVDENVFDVIDTGAGRGSADIFNISGVANYAMISSALLNYVSLKTGSPDQKTMRIRPTAAYLLEQYYRRENFWQRAAAKTQHWYICFSKIMAPSLICAMYALFFDINQGEADLFFEQLTTGQDIKTKSISQLRNKLLQDRLSNKRMKSNIKNAIIIKAWNIYRTKDESRGLVFDPAREEFPKAI